LSERRWRPIAPDRLAATVTDWLAGSTATLRVAVDGAPCTEPDAFAASLVPLLEAAGRPVGHVRAVTFWRDASLRLEYGREDVDSYASWLDADALRREVLEPATERAEYLPSLRDPQTNRSTREPPRPVPTGTILLVSGSLLLGRGLPFDRSVHLALSPAALARRTPPDQAWTLPAYESYASATRPAATADLVVKLDDPRHPALLTAV
jgi:hypothetical protein